MPRELVLPAIIAAQRGRGEKFGDSQNAMMVEFMREMMSAVNQSEIAAMECYHSMSWDRDRVLDAVLDGTRVELWSVHGPYGRYLDPSSPEQEGRDGARAALTDAVLAASRLKAKLVVVHPGADVPYEGVARQVQLDYAVETLRPIADLAAQDGLKVAVEPLPKREIGNSLDEILRIVERIGRPNVGINFDVNHLFPPEDIPAMIRRAGSLILSVHISDQDGEERHWLPFEGTMPWAEVLAALEEVGYAGPLIYEAHVKGAQDCAEVVRIVAENYRKLIARRAGGTP